jgi:hypothetical protein
MNENIGDWYSPRQRVLVFNPHQAAESGRMLHRKFFDKEKSSYG